MPPAVPDKEYEWQHEKGFMHIETSAGFFHPSERTKSRGKNVTKLFKTHNVSLTHSNPYFLKSFSEQIAATRLFISGIEYINAYSGCLVQS